MRYYSLKNNTAACTYNNDTIVALQIILPLQIFHQNYGGIERRDRQTEIMEVWRGETDRQTERQTETEGDRDRETASVKTNNHKDLVLGVHENKLHPHPGEL